MGTAPQGGEELTTGEVESLNSADTPQAKLSALIKYRTSIYIHPDVLKSLLSGRLFPVISRLAHEVHDG